jgi:hypothetical protein
LQSACMVKMQGGHVRDVSSSNIASLASECAPGACTFFKGLNLCIITVLGRQ